MNKTVLQIALLRSPMSGNLSFQKTCQFYDTVILNNTQSMMKLKYIQVSS